MQPDQLRARSCPTCHSIGEPRVWAEEAGKWVDVPPQTNISDKRCTNLWHIEVREPPSAEYHEAHRDDPEEWGEAMKLGKPRRRLASMISVRLSPDEVQQIRDAAERVGESVSTFLRTAALDRAATAPPARQDSPGATGDATAVPEATERRSAGCDDCDDVCTEKCACPGCTAPTEAEQRWNVIAWTCGCHPGVRWVALHDPTTVHAFVSDGAARPQLREYPSLPAFRSAAHVDLTPVAVDDVPALLADLSRVTRERDEARAQDCGHDLDAFQRQAAELATLRVQVQAGACPHTEVIGELHLKWLAEVADLKQRILDIDAHATPYGDIPDEPGWVGTYLVTAGSLHRALGKIGHSAPKCEAEADRDRLAETIRRWEPVIEAAKAWLRAAQESPTFQTMGTFGAGKALLALKDAAAALGDAGTQPDAEPVDRWRLAEWNSLPDECFIKGCDVTDIDQRGPIWLRDGSVRKACTEHWEPIMRVLGEQVGWEATDAYRSDPTSPTDTESGQRGRDADAPPGACDTCTGLFLPGDKLLYDADGQYHAQCLPISPVGTETADDLAEIDTTEADLDRMIAEGEPVEVVGPAQTFATSDPINRTWPPSGYLCVVRGNDGCPGHPSKWMTCSQDSTETGDDRG